MTTITYLGHASVLIETGGTRLLTDPLLRPRVAHLRRLGPLPSIPVLTAADAVLISHAHLDHLDLPSLRRIAPSVPVVAPRGWSSLVRRSGHRDVREVGPGDRLAIGEVEIRVAPAQHPGRRLPFGRSSQAVGYIVEKPRRVYFAGDTDLFDGMRSLAADLDLALLPVSGWGPRLPAGHLDPRRAAHAAALLRPRVAVPIHWGTLTSLWASPADSERPAREFARLAGDRAPDVQVQILRPGERWSLGPVRRGEEPL
jgi:L-ascorbate metabolism protein UlaG (beta-lactamase superfamily)